MHIDPATFALNVVSGMKYKDEESIEKNCKDKLTVYLSAYYLIENFNRLEVDSFKNMEKEEYRKMMLKLSHFRAF